MRATTVIPEARRRVSPRHQERGEVAHRLSQGGGASDVRGRTGKRTASFSRDWDQGWCAPSLTHKSRGKGVGGGLASAGTWAWCHAEENLTCGFSSCAERHRPACDGRLARALSARVNQSTCSDATQKKKEAK